MSDEQFYSEVCYRLGLYENFVGDCFVGHCFLGRTHLERIRSHGVHFAGRLENARNFGWKVQSRDFPVCIGCNHQSDYYNQRT
eukprot:UN02467